MRLPLLVLTLAAMAQAAVNEQAIAEVAAGKLKVAKASWWGFEPADSTKALQAAINSNVPKLVVDNVGQPWVVTPLRLVSNQEIEFEKGVEVVAKKGEFKGTNDSLLSADLKENIILRGYGATLRMQRADYDGPDYKHAEWRHCLSLKSCSNVRVEGLTLAESGGDGIYLGTAKQWVTNLNVTIKDVVLDKNYRQGISVITAENLLIENTIMRDTAGTAPMAGIDFEPNHPQERVLNVVMRNCVTENNKGGGFVFYVPNLDASSEQMTVRLENCRAINEGRAAFALYTGNRPAGAVRGSVVLTDCELRGGVPAPVIISDKPVNGCELRLERCTIVPTEASTAPILLQASQQAEEPLGGMEFRQCIIRDPVERPALAVTDMSGGVGVEKIGGVLQLERGGQRAELALTDELLNQWMPAQRLKKLPRYAMQGVAFERVDPQAEVPQDGLGAVRVRKIGRFGLYATKGEQVTFQVKNQEFVKYEAPPLPVTVTAPSGAVVCKAAVPFKQSSEVTFTAPESGLYRVVADPGMVTALVTGSSHPIGLLGEDQPIRLLASPGDYFFYVPAGTREFGVRVMGEGIGEFVSASLTDSTGAVRWSVSNIAVPHQFDLELPADHPGEVWKLRLDRPSKGAMEDHYVDLRGIPPLLVTSPAALLKPVK